jgi:hypothetical protein
VNFSSIGRLPHNSMTMGTGWPRGNLGWPIPTDPHGYPNLWTSLNWICQPDWKALDWRFPSRLTRPCSLISNKQDGKSGTRQRFQILPQTKINKAIIQKNSRLYVNTLATENKIKIPDLLMVSHTFFYGCQNLRMALQLLQVELDFRFEDLQESMEGSTSILFWLTFH